MHDIIGLRQFYSSPLGAQVKAWLRGHVTARIKQTHGETLVGLGYAAPLLRAIESLEDGPHSVIALMPGAQGALYWPVQGDNRVALCAMDCLPLQPNSVHWLIMLHTLEHAEDPKALLEEVHRVLVPGGRVLMMVPHRHRPWRWWGDSPFKEGKAYRYGELARLAREAEFTVTHSGGALMFPPMYHPLLTRIARGCERVFGLLVPRAGSVMCVELEKQIYAAMKQKKHKGSVRIGVQPIAATAIPNTRDDANNLND